MKYNSHYKSQRVVSASTAVRPVLLCGEETGLDTTCATPVDSTIR